MAEFAPISHKNRRKSRRGGQDESLLAAPQQTAPQADTRTLVTQIQQSPQSMTPGSVAQLQRDLGNRAVQRLFGSHKMPRLPTAPHQMPALPTSPGQMPPLPTAPNQMPALPTSPGQMPPLPTAPHQMPALPATPGAAAPARPMLPSPGAILSAPIFQANILAQARTPFQLGGARGGDAATAQEKAAKLAADRAAVIQDLMSVYWAYEANPTLPNMVKLHNKIDQWRITHWDHTSLREVGLRTEGVRALLDATSTAVEQKVHAETTKNGASGDAADAVLGAAKKKQKAPKKIKFFEKVGVPQAFYSTLTPAQVKLFKKLYDALAKNKPQYVPGLLGSLEAQNIVGYSLIKGLFMTAFPKVVGIDHFQSTEYLASAETKYEAYKSDMILSSTFGKLTDAEKQQYIKEEKYATANREGAGANLKGLARSKGLSDAELATLQEYTGGGYVGMNSKLRGNVGEKDKGIAGKAFNESALVVSALNKLPAYKGLAYRMQNSFADFDAAVKPGGTYTDLGFMSASMTQQGAESGGTSGGKGKGALEIYMIIHSKTAADITFLSRISLENEVLFKPGTRFKINAVWTHQNGQIPKNAPPEARMILTRAGEIKEGEKMDENNKKIKVQGKVRVIEMTES